MAVARFDISAPIEEVFRVLANGWMYPHWVPGPRNVHLVDRRFPQPGTRFLHTLGRGPIRSTDFTEVIESEPPRRLVLRARGWPSGLSRVYIQLVPARGGTRVSIRETPEHGLALALRLPGLRRLLDMRLYEMLRRLGTLAEHFDMSLSVRPARTRA
ncbi:MAG: SRPBCC domain-containing protein [Myxococcaceae bacterium]